MKNSMQSKPFNIAIIPPKEITNIAILLSKQLKRKSGRFVLGQKKYVPHITLYMTEFPLSNVVRVRKQLRKLSKQNKPLQLSSLGYRQNTDGFVDMRYRKSPRVKDLQNKIIATLNSLRKGLLRGKDNQRMAEYSKRAKNNVVRFGYRSIGKDYYPHLTLTRLKNTNRSVITKTRKISLSFTATKIGLFYLGEHGTCQKKVEYFNLAQ
jgi:2'-5' RNA ligase